jgi:hypothetical protein
MYKKSYLPPKSQEWGRSLEDEINENIRLNKLDEINLQNDLKQINSSIFLMNRNKNDLVLQQNLLEAQQMDLENQADYLESLVTYYSLSPDIVSTNITGYQGIDVGSFQSDLIEFDRDSTAIFNVQGDAYSLVRDYPFNKPFNSRQVYPAVLFSGGVIIYRRISPGNEVIYRTFGMGRDKGVSLDGSFSDTWWQDGAIVFRAKLHGKLSVNLEPGSYRVQVSFLVIMPCDSGYAQTSNRSLSISIIS